MYITSISKKGSYLEDISDILLYYKSFFILNLFFIYLINKNIILILITQFLFNKNN